jgi:hypothetical protein
MKGSQWATELIGSGWTDSGWAAPAKASAFQKSAFQKLRVREHDSAGRKLRLAANG